MFQNPQFVYIIPLVLMLLGLLYIQSRRKRRRRVAQLSGIHEIASKALNNHSVVRSRLKVTCTILGFLFLLLALGRPQFGFQWIDIRKSERNLLILLDVSRSMLVQDVYPNRLGRSKLIIQEIIERNPDTNIGLLIFAGTAFLQCPITEDHAALRDTLALQSPEVLKDQGSDLSKALLMVPELIKSPAKDRIIVISDGEDHSTRLSLAIQYLHDRQIVVNTICIGTEKGGLIPSTETESSEPYFYDRLGNVVYSKANPKLMQNVASQLQGRTLHFNSENYSIRRLDELLIADKPTETKVQKERKVPVEYYQLPLAFAFVLLCLELAIGTRRSEPPAVSRNRLS